MDIVLLNHFTATVCDIDLLLIQFRTTADYSERHTVDALISTHHYLPYHGLFSANFISLYLTRC